MAGSPDVWKEETLKRKMTVVFEDESLYIQLKVEAIKRHTAASSIISEAVREWLESREDAELLPAVEAARSEWKQKGGRPWSEVEKDLDGALLVRDRPDDSKGV
jgi:hypothetical protein